MNGLARLVERLLVVHEDGSEDVAASGLGDGGLDRLLKVVTSAERHAHLGPADLGDRDAERVLDRAGDDLTLKVKLDLERSARVEAVVLGVVREVERQGKSDLSHTQRH